MLHQLENISITIKNVFGDTTGNTAESHRGNDFLSKKQI